MDNDASSYVTSITKTFDYRKNVINYEKHGLILKMRWQVTLHLDYWYIIQKDLVHILKLGFAYRVLFVRGIMKDYNAKTFNFVETDTAMIEGVVIVWHICAIAKSIILDILLPTKLLVLGHALLSINFMLWFVLLRPENLRELSREAKSLIVSKVLSRIGQQVEHFKVSEDVGFFNYHIKG